MVAWTHFGPTVVTSFLASLVEFVEALTVVLAVGAVRGWRFALTGATAALALLGFAVALFGPSLAALPLPWVRLVVGGLILLFGLRWLRKAILRAGGVIPKHDETKSFREATQSLERAAGPGSDWDAEAFLTAFKIVLLEGVEVVFIVVAIAANERSPWPAIGGAGAALAVVVVAGLLVHRPLARVPENTLKFAVGVLTTAFGTLMVGEALHLAWPGGDGALPVLIACEGLLALALIPLARGAPGVKKPAATHSGGPWAAIVNELKSLFVDDPWLAAGAALWVGVCAATLPALAGPPAASCGVFFAGLALVLGFSVRRASTASSHNL